MNPEPQSNSIARAERGDFVYVGALSPSTFDDLLQLSAKNDWPELQKHMQPEQVLLLIERLKHCADDPVVFSHGKWAVIQQLQHLFEKGFWK